MRVMRRSLAASIGLILGLMPTAPVAAQDGTMPPARPADAAQQIQIARSILHQVQPCANRQVNPSPGANRIWVQMKLHLARDGSLAEIPQIVGHGGVDGDNERYVGQIDAAAMASFEHCTPLHGLPAELYDGPGGWSHIMMRYKLPG